MTTTELAKEMGTTRASILRAVLNGLIPREAYRWRGKSGRRRTLIILDPALVKKHWLPRSGTTPTKGPAAQSLELGDDASAAEARRVREIYLARLAKLDFDLQSGRLIEADAALAAYARIAHHAKSAFLALASKARGRIPHLTIDDTLVIDGMVREILTDLADGSSHALDAKKAKPPRSRRREASSAAAPEGTP
jgi:hypothetical protein